MAVAPPTATLEALITYFLCGICLVYAALCGVLLGRPGLIFSVASTPCSMCPETCVCSSFDLSTTGRGVSSYQHLSRGDALWYTTYALLTLLAPKLRFVSHLFLLAAVSFSYLPFCITLCSLFYYHSPPYRTNPRSPALIFCTCRGIPAPCHLLFSPCSLTSNTAWLMIPPDLHSRWTGQSTPELL